MEHLLHHKSCKLSQLVKKKRKTGYILAMQMRLMTLNKMTLLKVKYNIYSCFDMV